ncbi:conserved hypothetical protein [Verticillium alfalfae VaMs.102]|uniref:37S ribosomal protein mrp51 n=1 Tax=Verticillium alfalfae (strain VaMs.102 / ATCC MYA-4576 / FGSC 10136) TaxID=526221 RepID=C9SUN1_VERA1|nr:conserved hypothetical protein [Verticillium alfalfae VaMs.102]EEY22141.1 conserved hypothetical protein [Verticillium alfalfae VaMs.102]
MSARLSPGGALLRSSRLFSVPKPIPGPSAASEDAGYGSTLRRPTGTSPYPTHQSITTPESSRSQGDWGLKRSLPLKMTTKSSTPSIHVKHLDSIEKITDYSSSSQHSITLQKFQELNLPLTVPTLPNRYRAVSLGTTSVFEDDHDVTAVGGTGSDKRWKFEGPWLAGLTEGQFENYVQKTVRNRRQEFQAFLRTRLASDLTAAQQQAALDKAIEAPAPVVAKDVTEDQLTEYTRKLRSDRVTLFALISEFLDLAPLNPPSAIANMSAGTRIESKSPNPYAERGPPITHPSGGLSYIRTNAHAENHPLYGPQANPSPVLARIISPRHMSNPAKLGVAGFITDTPQGDSAFNYRSYRGGKARVSGIATFDPEITGGSKCYVEPVSANINSAGKLVLKVDEASEEAQMIKKELIGKAEIYNNKNPNAHALESEPRTHSQRLGGYRGSPLGRRDGSPLIRRQPKPGKAQTGSSQSYGLDK